MAPNIRNSGGSNKFEGGWVIILDMGIESVILGNNFVYKTSQL